MAHGQDCPGLTEAPPGVWFTFAYDQGFFALADLPLTLVHVRTPCVNCVTAMMKLHVTAGNVLRVTFKGPWNLADVRFPDGLRALTLGLGSDVDLKGIVFPEGVKVITFNLGYGMTQSSLNSVEWPKSMLVLTVYPHAFDGERETSGDVE